MHLFLLACRPPEAEKGRSPHYHVPGRMGFSSLTPHLSGEWIQPVFLEARREHLGSNIPTSSLAFNPNNESGLRREAEPVLGLGEQ